MPQPNRQTSRVLPAMNARRAKPARMSRCERVNGPNEGQPRRHRDTKTSRRGLATEPTEKTLRRAPPRFDGRRIAATQPDSGRCANRVGRLRRLAHRPDPAPCVGLQSRPTRRTGARASAGHFCCLCAPVFKALSLRFAPVRSELAASSERGKGSALDVVSVSRCLCGLMAWCNRRIAAPENAGC